jgi:hypothetical protein
MRMLAAMGQARWNLLARTAHPKLQVPSSIPDVGEREEGPVGWDPREGPERGLTSLLGAPIGGGAGQIVDGIPSMGGWGDPGPRAFLHKPSMPDQAPVKPRSSPG